jgi:hypothetical protein
MTSDKATPVWTLRHRDGRTIVGVVTFLNDGHVEGQLLSDGAMLYSQAFQTGGETLAWLEEEEKIWQAPT